MNRPHANHRNVRSPWRKKSLVGVAAGQRYQVTYRDGLGTRRTFGWAGTEQAAQAMVRAIEKHSAWRSAKIIDTEARD